MIVQFWKRDAFSIAVELFVLLVVSHLRNLRATQHNPNLIMPAHTYEFVQLDVFTQTPLSGNPLAIFPDAGELTNAEMQALAREMNLSETTFIFPRDGVTEAREGKKVR